MDFLRKNKTIIGVLVVIILGFAAYSFFFVGEDELLITPETGGAAVGVELLSLLLELRSLQFDETLFDDDAFNALQDFSQELIPEPVGRRNPFAPIGTDESVAPPQDQGGPIEP